MERVGKGCWTSYLVLVHCSPLTRICMNVCCCKGKQETCSFAIPGFSDFCRIFCLKLDCSNLFWKEGEGKIFKYREKLLYDDYYIAVNWRFGQGSGLGQ